MQIQFKGTNYELTNDVTALAERKLEGLRKFLGASGEAAQAYVDLGRASAAHHSGDIWYAEANVNAGGHRFNAKASGETLRSAIHRMANELRMELSVAKKKREAAKRRGDGLKNFFRFGS